MTKISNKFIIGALISIAIGTVCIACNSVSNKAMATPPNSSQLSSSIESSSETVSLSESSILNSNMVNSKIESSSVSKSMIKSSIAEKQKVSSASSQRKVIKMAENTQSVTSTTNTQTQTSSSSDGIKITITDERYGVVNPETGAYVPTSDPNYEKYKAELGGDAGTVPDNKSTACQAVIQKIEAKNKLDATSSTDSSPN